MLRSSHLGYATLVAGFVFVSACGTDLGPCDMNAATAIVYKRGPDGNGCASWDQNGPLCTTRDQLAPATYYMPYTEGQAIAHASCGSGGICHSESATGALRNGAPSGLNFDVAIRANTLDRIGVLNKPAGHATLLDWLDESWELIQSGEMPPGAAGVAAQSRGKWFKRSVANLAAFVKDEAYALPMLDTAQGKETIRNWLACGAPVVNGNAVLGQIVPPEVIPPTWTDIHELVISDSCIACHSGTPSPFMNGTLIMSDVCGAWRALVNHTPSAASMCPPYPGALVVPGQPESSLLMRKLDRSPTGPVFGINSTDPLDCGYPMPLMEAQLGQSARDSIRAWIAGGVFNGVTVPPAAPPPGCTP